MVDDREAGEMSEGWINIYENPPGATTVPCSCGVCKNPMAGGARNARIGNIYALRWNFGGNEMIDEKILAKVFRAAGNGAMEPYNSFFSNMQAGGSVTMLPPHFYESQASARSLACAFHAIADVFEKCGEAVDESDRTT